MTIYSQDEVKTIINRNILNELDQQQVNATNIDPAYGQLWRSIKHLMLAGGKRIRPYLTYASYMLFEDKADDDVFTIATAQEFLHFALLIHDDIIDRDSKRYGQKNIIGEYLDIYAEAGSDAEHFANGAALMAGDLALAQAYNLINQSSFSADIKFKTSQHLSRSIFHVAGGELLDMEAAFRFSSADYFTIAQYKTASYSFIGPLLTGASLTSASDSALRLLSGFGLNLGIAYQLADDLLGLYGDEESIGKPITSDLRERKKTHLFELIQQLSSATDRHYFNQVWGKSDITEQDIEKVRGLGIETGAKKRVEELMRSYAKKALESLDSLPIAKERANPLREIADKAIHRTF